MLIGVYFFNISNAHFDANVEIIITKAPVSKKCPVLARVVEETRPESKVQKKKHSQLPSIV